MRTTIKLMSYELLTTLFWDFGYMARRSLVYAYVCYGGTCCLHLQGLQNRPIFGRWYTDRVQWEALMTMVMNLRIL
jgi:hypothetical protein